MGDDGMFHKNSIAVRISREMALDYGLVQPTPEEEAERAESRARYEQQRRESWVLYDAARPALGAITDPLARAVLDLHESATVEYPKCEGCDMDGWEAERPEWPCRTVQAVAAHFGIALPDPPDLWRRPDPADRTAPTGTAAGGEGEQ